MKREELESLVIKWGNDKGLNNPVKQTLKTLSEAGELADAVCKSNLESFYDDGSGTNTIDNFDKILDAIGDIEVCLTILKDQIRIGQTEALEAAYNEISGRKGKTINGTFIKE